MELKHITDFRSQHDVLTSPMNQKELKNAIRKDGTLTAKVVVPFSDSVKFGLEWLNDEVSDMITGSTWGLTDIGFNVAGRTTDDELILKITGVPVFDED